MSDSNDSQNTNSSMEGMIKYAEDAMKQEDWSTAIQRWKHLLTSFKSDAPYHVYVLMSMAFRFQNDVVSAEKIIKEGINLFPKNIVIIKEFSKVIKFKQDYLEAISKQDNYEKKHKPQSSPNNQLKLNSMSYSISFIEKIQLVDKMFNLEKKSKKLVLKVAFLCRRSTSFIEDIEREISKQHQVRILHFNYQSPDLQAVQDAMDWADVTWFEWCEELIVQASHNVRKTSKVICRLHRFECFSGYPSNIKSNFIDIMVYVSQHMMTHVLQMHRLNTPGAVIWNGVDLSKYCYVKRLRGFNVAFVGYIKLIKNPQLLIQVIAALRNKDVRYRLHIAGAIKDIQIKYYLEHQIKILGLEKNVLFYGHVSDINNWLEDKNYLISTSLSESFGVNIIEAMAKGIKPIIHNWPGANELYPPELVFTTVDEAVNLIISKNYDSAMYNKYVNKFCLKKQIEKIYKLISDVGCKHEKKQINSLDNYKDVVMENELTPKCSKYENYLNFQFIKRMDNLTCIGTSEDVKVQIQNKIRNNKDNLIRVEKVANCLNDFNIINEIRKRSIAQKIRQDVVRYIASTPDVQKNRLDVYRCEFERFTNTKFKKWQDILFYSFSFKTSSAVINIPKKSIGDLCDPAKKIYSRNRMLSFDGMSPILHGSLANGEYTYFSDVDISIFIDPKYLADNDKRLNIVSNIDNINNSMLSVDPIGHHGCFINSINDLNEYPEPNMPLSVLNKGVMLNLDNFQYNVCKRISSDDIAFMSLYKMCDYFIKLPFNLIKNDAKTIKNIISRFFIINLLYYELYYNKYEDKKTILSSIDSLSTEIQKECLGSLTKIRKVWTYLDQNAYGYLSPYLIYLCASSAIDILVNINNSGCVDKITSQYINGA
ncbi:glycosyltransferase [Desulfonatronum thiodismutans]|uniref:glycosyltransferase n=1 Tax=Desulfonatronum thiodismutans TaxID=159290 RepID=UPI000A001618|nr:glycosyltransferase [Desulfonatronum thiodismutans]